MASVSRLPWRQIVVVLLIFGGGCPGSLPAARSAEAQTLHGIQSDRNRVMLGFRAKPEVIQEWLPSPWQLDPVPNGPLQGANFFVVLVDRIRDDDPTGNPRFHGADQLINFTVPARHPQTGQTVSAILSGWASNAARNPGFFQVYRPASNRVEQIIKSEDGDAEEVTDIWEVRDAAGQGRMALQLQSRRLLSTRTRARGAMRAISAKDPAVAQRHQFDALVDVVRSLPDAVDRVQHYAFRLDQPEFSALFDGSEQLIGISVTPWYVRQVFTP